MIYRVVQFPNKKYAILTQTFLQFILQIRVYYCFEHKQFNIFRGCWDSLSDDDCSEDLFEKNCLRDYLTVVDKFIQLKGGFIFLKK